MDPFVHLHVASGYSMRHGASHPHVLVDRAAEHGMDALALTDRDGAYGAVKFALACEKAAIRPIFGVDLAFHGTPRPEPESAGSGRRRGAVRSCPPTSCRARPCWPATSAAGRRCAG